MEAVHANNIIEHSISIKSRPQKEWFATPKEMVSVKAVGTGTHCMTQKKLRAQDAREMFKETKKEETKKEEETGKKSKKVFTDSQIKGSAQATKKKKSQRENELVERSVNDEYTRKVRKDAQE